MKDIVPAHIIKRLQEIISLKQQGKEKDIAQNEVKLDNYIEAFLKDDSDAPKDKQLATLNELNDELRRIVLCKIKSQRIK